MSRLLPDQFAICSCHSCLFRQWLGTSCD